MKSSFRFRRVRTQSLPRRMVSSVILLLCMLLIVHVWGMEAFVVPTGSMAPALAGHHRVCSCPRCGFRVVVGRQPADEDGKGGADCYQGAMCPNCGLAALPLGKVPEATGDHILVNKNVFLFRRPRRWEIVVFRMGGKVYVKRIIGLPGEWLLIEDGDIFIDEALVRKSLEEFKAVRILVFDNNCQPASEGWRQRWRYQGPKRSGPVVPRDLAAAHLASIKDMLGEAEEADVCRERPPWRSGRADFQSAPYPDLAPNFLDGTDLFLSTLASPRHYHWLTYCHVSLDSGKIQPLRDEYAYNGGLAGGEEDVHDFMLDCDVQVQSGTGHVALGITDGQDVLVTEIPVGHEGKVSVTRFASGKLPPVGNALRGVPARGELLAQVARHLEPGRSHHVELAFVDRRLTLAVDGSAVFARVDLPPARVRRNVSRPVSLGAKGTHVVFRNVRLYRDIHYTQAGRHAVRGEPVRLAMDQYFVMGDNSPNSEDSRFWPNQGGVPAGNLMGKPFLVHLPSRVVSGFRFGQLWFYQLPDWDRLRWLH